MAAAAVVVVVVVTEAAVTVIDDGDDDNGDDHDGDDDDNDDDDDNGFLGVNDRTSSWIHVVTPGMCTFSAKTITHCGLVTPYDLINLDHHCLI